jgi:serine/threonine protein kinase
MQGYNINPIPLGIDSFGTTMKAVRISDSLDVCLKISHDITNEFDRKLFENEAEMMNKISHSNIIRYVESFWFQKKFCIVMEFADRGNLQEKMTQKLNDTEILNILVQILESLKYLHSKNIFYPDLKPSIILFVKGKLKLSNFGVTKTISSQFVFNQAKQFMAPEMFLENKRQLKFDIWSVGVIIYYLAAKKFPFDSQNEKELEQLILETDPMPLPATFASNFRNIILSMLNKNTLLRPTTEKLLNTIHQEFLHLFSSNFDCNILRLFSQLHYHDLLKIYHFDTDSISHESSFDLFFHNFRNDIWLNLNIFYQISLNQNKMILKSYSIQSQKAKYSLWFPLSWQIEVFDKSKRWILIEKHQNVEEIKEIGKIMPFNFQFNHHCQFEFDTLLSSLILYSILFQKSFILV